MDTDISSLELGLQKRLEKLQPKTKKPDFLRSVIDRQSVRIDGALALGYSYDEIASIFSEQGIKCKGSTLKKYHLMAKRKLAKESPIPELPSDLKSSGNKAK
ncbi:hypothetical protein [Chroococcus sp. FPU101]|uniref:hypothetical protein n=1 Tax=Chroococcus sp. FPU101 TaxID=1974212 RepID=UPI001A8F8816|nr:hypothetical protein [Chroococcus sp. FPU101]GFE71720.1 hypothetical protein CFPU101_43300 [Chroococcus sp. FPU101]